MTDPYPKPYDELVAENASLRDQVAALRASIGSLRSGVIGRDAEIARLRRPKTAPRALDKGAKDAFQRPAYAR